MSESTHRACRTTSRVASRWETLNICLLALTLLVCTLELVVFPTIRFWRLKPDWATEALDSLPGYASPLPTARSVITVGKEGVLNTCPRVPLILYRNSGAFPTNASVVTLLRNGDARLIDVNAYEWGTSLNGREQLSRVLALADSVDLAAQAEWTSRRKKSL